MAIRNYRDNGATPVAAPIKPAKSDRRNLGDVDVNALRERLRTAKATRKANPPRSALK